MTSLTTISWTATGNASEAVSHALFAGNQSDGKKVYVGRVTDGQGNFIPSKIIPEENKAFFEEGGEEKTSDKMEYLFHNEGYEWLRSSGGKIVPDAVLLSDNYIGRAEIDGTTIVGKVDLKNKYLIASHYGEILKLNEYDVLVFKPSTNKIHFQTYEKVYNSLRSDSSSIISNRMYVENSFNQGKFLEMQHKIQTLELELSNARNERRDYEHRLLMEERKNQDIQKQIQFLRLETSTYNNERSSFEERLSFESSRSSKLEMELKKYENETVLLLKKVASLEEALRAEKYQLETYTSKFKSSQTLGTDSNRIKSLEEKLKNQQQRIFELELLLENNRSDSDSFKSRITSYESSIEQQKIQVESLLKKLQGTNADKEYLVQQVSLLTQSIKQYQFEIESMTAQLQNAKAIIASLTAELGRANGQLAKFQAALSNSYLLNGELMTKVSSMSTMTSYKNSFESKFDLLSINLNSIEASAKAYTYSTPSLLEAAGSDTYMRYIRSSSSASSDVNVENGNVTFTPYSVKEEEPVPDKA